MISGGKHKIEYNVQLNNPNVQKDHLNGYGFQSVVMSHSLNLFDWYDAIFFREFWFSEWSNWLIYTFIDYVI